MDFERPFKAIFRSREKTAAHGKIHEGAAHVKARTEKAAGYPDRFPVFADTVRWQKDYPSYAPPYHVDPSVIENDRTTNPKGWAQPEDHASLPREEFKSYEPLQFDEEGRPLNPRGRTGIKGRGLLGKWGANFAADNIITRPTEDGRGTEVFLVLRKDGQWAFPAGMVDYGEKIAQAARRELKEETGVDLDIESGGSVVYQGYVDDPRNTDNAWMESTFFHKHFNREETAAVVAKESDDAETVRTGWFTVAPELMKSMYASHGQMLELALERA